MVYSEVREAGSGYRYDGLGRRTLSQEAGREAMRTTSDGKFLVFNPHTKETMELK
jgi:hypothetical protein